MKTITKYLMMMIAMLAIAVNFSSCDPDPDPEPEPPTSGVVGRWSNDSNTLVLYFDEDGSGTWTEKAKDSNGNSVTYDYNFVYTYNESTGLLKLNIKGASMIENYDVNLTGNTMMLTYTSDGKRYSYVLTR